MITLIHIIELHVIHVGQQIAKRIRVVFRIVRHLGYQNALHFQDNWFIRPYPIHRHLFRKVSQQSRIIGHRDCKPITATNTFLRIIHLRTATISLHLTNSQMATAPVSQFKRGCYRNFETRFSYVDDWCLGNYSLSINN